MTFDRFKWYNAWIDDPRVPDELISVLAVLFRYINTSGVCYPSQAMISDHLQKGVRTIQRRLQAIERLGYLERWGGHTTYQAKFPPEHTTPMTHQATPMTQSSSMEATPMTPDATPVTETGDTHDACTVEQATPMTPKGDTHDAPTRHPCRLHITDHITDHLTDHSSSGVGQDLGVSENPETAYQPPPQQKLLELCQEAKINLAEFQINQLWNSVSKTLGEAQAWEYLHWKLADLHGTEYPVRRKFEYLSNGIPDWLKAQGQRAVGRNDFPTSYTPVPAADEAPQAAAAEPVPVVNADAAQAAWSAALPTLKASVSQRNYTDWLAPLTPIGIEHGTLHIDAHDGFKAVYVDDTYRKLILDSLTAAGAGVDSIKLHPEEVLE